MIHWYLGLLASLVSLIGVYYTYRALSNTAGKLRNSMDLFAASITLGAVAVLLMFSLGAAGISIDNPLWYGIPLFFSGSTITFLLSMHGILQLFSKLSKL